MTERLAAAGNYQSTSGRQICYLVIHYTANDGDTARNNLRYFADNVVQASAHYFVDANEVGRSVKESDIAWHCGAKQYRHSACRNANSIGIELCSKKDAAGRYVFEPATVTRAVELCRELMARYDIPVERVLRHYDVTGKCCPAPFVQDEAAWRTFLQRLEGKHVQKAEEPSIWAKEAAAWAEAQNLIQGDETGNCRWQDELTRQELAVILHRFVNCYHLEDRK